MRKGERFSHPRLLFASSIPQPQPPQTSKLTKQQAPGRARPVSLSVANESHLHAGHSGNPSGHPDAETHFRVDAVSEAFEGKNPVARHRLVYAALGSELKAGLHALALKTRTPREAQAAAEAKEAAK